MAVVLAISLALNATDCESKEPNTLAYLRNLNLDEFVELFRQYHGRIPNVRKHFSYSLNSSQIKNNYDPMSINVEQSSCLNPKENKNG